MNVMDFYLARRLVWKAARIVLAYQGLDPTLLKEDDDLTLEHLGLVTPEHRDNFRSVLVEQIRQEGYNIDPTNIPRAPRDTLLRVASLLPGESTKIEDP
jgi:hypothetical protein